MGSFARKGCIILCKDNRIYPLPGPRTTGLRDPGSLTHDRTTTELPHSTQTTQTTVTTLLVTHPDLFPIDLAALNVYMFTLLNLVGVLQVLFLLCTFLSPCSGTLAK